MSFDKIKTMSFMASCPALGIRRPHSLWSNDPRRKITLKRRIDSDIQPTADDVNSPQEIISETHMKFTLQSIFSDTQTIRLICSYWSLVGTILSLDVKSSYMCLHLLAPIQISDLLDSARYGSLSLQRGDHETSIIPILLLAQETTIELENSVDDPDRCYIGVIPTKGIVGACESCQIETHRHCIRSKRFFCSTSCGQKVATPETCQFPSSTSEGGLGLTDSYDDKEARRLDFLTEVNDLTMRHLRLLPIRRYQVVVRVILNSRTLSWYDLVASQTTFFWRGRHFSHDLSKRTVSFDQEDPEDLCWKQDK